MTAIVGLVDNGRVIIGGDSAGVAGLQSTERADAKVFVNGPYAMGFTTSFRMGQLLQYTLRPPKPPRTDTFGFMVTEFIDAVRDCLKAGGYASKESDVESGGEFLVGVHGSLYEIGSDYQVGVPADGYAAVGCGDDVALGSLFTTRSSDLTAEERVTAALLAAAHHSAGVRGPFALVSSTRRR